MHTWARWLASNGAKKSNRRACSVYRSNIGGPARKGSRYYARRWPSLHRATDQRVGPIPMSVRRRRPAGAAEVEAIQANPSVADHEQRVLQRRHIVHGALLHGDEVGVVARLDDADRLLEAQHLRVDDGRRLGRL